MSYHFSSRNTSKGFTLVEILVAMLIGLIAMLVMFQVFSASEERRRTTTGAGDTISVGNIALVNLQNQILQGGFGFISSGANMQLSILGCRLELPNAMVLPQLAPVIINESTAIVPAGDPDTDTLLIVHGAGVGSQEGVFLMTSGNLQNPTPGGEAIPSYTVMGTHTIRMDDLVIATSPNPHPNCQATPLVTSQVTGVEAQFITVNRGGPVLSGVLYNLGQRPGTPGLSAGHIPSIRAYRVLNSTLMECDLMQGDCTQENNWISIAPDIVSLRAEYRLQDGTYTRAIPTTSAAQNRACGYARIQGVRLALVARNPQKARTAVTVAAPRWSGQEPINLTHIPDWDFYRYTTFETLISIRNINWMGVLDATFCS